MRAAASSITGPRAAPAAHVDGERQPVDLEAEAHVLALALRYGQLAAIDASQLGHPAMRAAWRALEAVIGAGEPITLAAVTAELRAGDELRLLQIVGGLEHLVRLWAFGRAVVPETIDYWCARVRAAARRRRLALLAARLHEAALLGDEEDVDAALAELHKVAGW